MKEWRKVTFMKEWLKALDLTVILCYRDLLYLFSFRSYGRLKKKCRYKQISFTKSLLLLKGHFQSSLIFPFQCSITHVHSDHSNVDDCHLYSQKVFLFSVWIVLYKYISFINNDCFNFPKKKSMFLSLFVFWSSFDRKVEMQS